MAFHRVDCIINMVFNAVPMNTQDAQLIADLGGPAKVAELLKYDKQNGGVQRVQNWITRGIPPKVKLQFPEVFLVAGKPKKSTAKV